jgi:C-terminal processing protease CtpA/Prc
VSRVVYVTPDWKGAKRLREHWLDESGFGGSASGDLERMRGSGYEVDRWDHVCIKSRKLLPGTEVTEKVNQALKRVKDPDEPSEASQPISPKVQHDAPIADPEAHDAAKLETPTSQSITHGTIGASADGNPRVRHDGVTVSQVVAGGPADQVGIKVGDVILAIDDHYLFTSEELNNMIDRCKPDSTIRIRYRRYSMTYETSLIVTNRETAKTEN